MPIWSRLNPGWSCQAGFLWSDSIENKINMRMRIARGKTPAYALLRLNEAPVFVMHRPSKIQGPTEGIYIARSDIIMPTGMMLDTGSRATKNHVIEKKTGSEALIIRREKTIIAARRTKGKSTLASNREKGGGNR